MKNLLSLLLLSSFYSFGQTPVVDWIRIRGGSQGDYATCVIQTADNGFLTGGLTSSNDGDVTGNDGNADMWLQKFDANGNFQWQQMYGGTGTEWAQSVIPTSDGGYAASGETFSNDGDVSGNAHWGAWIVKMAADGTLTWQKSYGNDGSGQADVRKLIQTPDGGYVLAGLTQANGGDVTGFHGEYDFWVIRLDGNGNLLWQKALGGSGDDQANAIQQTPDGGFIVAGWTSSTDGDVSMMYGCYDGWLVKLSATGDIEWEKAMGTQNCEIINDLKVTPDGGYVYVGYRGYDALVVKTDAEGNVLWENQIGGTNQDELESISLTADGGYLASGFTHSVDGDLAGVPGEGKAWFMGLGPDGEILWQRKLGQNGMIDYGNGIIEIAAGQYIACGLTYSYTGNPDIEGQSDMFIAKLVFDEMATDNFANAELSVWPNPASTLLNVTLPGGTVPTSFSIADSAGRIIGTYRNSNIDVSTLAEGVYFLTVNAEAKVFKGKFVKE